MKKASIRLSYLSVKEIRNSEREPKAQPCVVHPDGRKPFRVVPVAPLILDGRTHECIGCIGQHGTDVGQMTDCGLLPDCSNSIFVRATPANKLKHIAWLLDQNN